jgi:tripartite-type tricarboxylate transporter receptor subunit TctC
VNITHVPYKGSPPVVADLLAGNLQLALSTVPPVLPHAKGGKLRLLAISTANRSPVLPELPTIDEAGLKGYASGLWTGLLAPAGTPREIVAKLVAETAAALAAADVKDALGKQGADPVAVVAPEPFSATIRGDLARWRGVIRDAGIKLGD